ncbi:ATP-binding protein [Ningiella sp. W23]|uniref:ATP-binding protein n=1 Tax=Ningiella sp. W23 TaxID=3023715 RepID=UPI0037573AAD
MKNVSLSTYIFAITGMFLLGLAAIQYGVVKAIESKINEEITSRSISLSNQALDFVITGPLQNMTVNHNTTAGFAKVNKELSQVTKQQIQDLIEESYSKAEKELSEAKIRMEVDSLSEDVAEKLLPYLTRNLSNKDAIAEHENLSQSELMNVQIIQIKEQLKQLSIVQEQENVLVFKTPSFEVQRENMFFTNDNSSIAKYLAYLSYTTLGLGLLSLLFAYALAKHISGPLERLSEGFLQLSKGNFDHTLNTRGVKEVERTLSMFNETSARLKQLQHIEQQYSQQQQLAELGEISRGIAHSLRNPLNTIGLAIEEMSRDSTSSERKSTMAKQVRQKIEALDRSIKSLLVLTTSGIDRTQTLSIESLIKDAMMQHSIGSEAEVTIACPQDLHVRGAATELSAIISTLLSNALEACQHNAALPQVHIIAEQANAAIKIQVTDNGCGISADAAALLFKPDFTTKAEGAGMGLYIAKRIAVLHYNGDLQLENNKDSGCTATLTISSAEMLKPPHKDEL